MAVGPWPDSRMQEVQTVGTGCDRRSLTGQKQRRGRFDEGRFVVAERHRAGAGYDIEERVALGIQDLE